MARRHSLESTQSFELLSSPSASNVSVLSTSDEDKIVWSVSSLSLSDQAIFSPSSEEFVVLSPASVPSSYASGVQAFVEDDLISNPPILSQPPTPIPENRQLRSSSQKSRRTRSCNTQQQPQLMRGKPPIQPASKPSDNKTSASPQSKKRRKRGEKSNEVSSPRGKPKGLVVLSHVPGSSAKGLGARSVVDDATEGGNDNNSVFEDGRSEFSSVLYDNAVHYINWCVPLTIPPFGCRLI